MNLFSVAVYTGSALNLDLAQTVLDTSKYCYSWTAATVDDYTAVYLCVDVGLQYSIGNENVPKIMTNF